MSSLVLPHEVLVPALPSCVIEPIWEQFFSLITEHDVVHPLGCHRPRIPDRDRVLQARAVAGCRRRLRTGGGLDVFGDNDPHPA